MPNEKRDNSQGQDSKSDTQAFNEQDFEGAKTKGGKSIKKTPQETGQDRERMSNMGLKDSKNTFSKD